VVTPARGYSWAPFGRGNTAATRHGVWSSRQVDPVVGELVAGLLAERPELDAYPEAVYGWARAEARCLLLAEWTARHGLLDDEGKPTVALRYVGTFERLAAEQRARLGLDPRSEAELAQTRSDAMRNLVDLDALRAKGRQALDARDEPRP
jgi:hypothetical protein